MVDTLNVASASCFSCAKSPLDERKSFKMVTLVIRTNGVHEYLLSLQVDSPGMPHDVEIPAPVRTRIFRASDMAFAAASIERGKWIGFLFRSLVRRGGLVSCTDHQRASLQEPSHFKELLV